MNALPWTIYLCLAGAALLRFWPGRSDASVRAGALGVAVGTLILTINAACRFEPMPDGSLITLTKAEWIPAIGASYHLAADGISLTLVLLTSIAATVGVLFSWNISHRLREFFALYFLLLAGVFGVFLSADLFLLFVFYEIAIVPKYFLIAIWGSTNREYGAMKLALYSFVGSALVLIGLLAAHVFTGGSTFDLAALAHKTAPVAQQMWIYPLLFIGFAVLAGLWPFHTWAPTGHVAAPTAASMLLAGVVMKLGAYGCLRVAIPLCPDALAAWQLPFASLAVIGILFGAFAAMVQDDFKFVIGYSSVSHMGFALLGISTLTLAGQKGAVMQMFSHGIIAGLLFGIVGRMIYDRTHTRDLTLLQGMRLTRKMPFVAGTFVVAGLASMGMPGFSGFIAELAVLQGSWKPFPAIALLAAVGVLLAAGYTLRVIRLVFFPDEESTKRDNTPLAPLTWPEISGTLLLIGIALYIGLQPAGLMGWIEGALKSPLMRPCIGGGLP
ncbi:MAG: NADH-quinone oxidoreductase subunit M [Verrucomicrobiales bacterium]|nr:NADH-quinone oxidoreductase subunit M [Verrucomicrobiales bacterium]MCP5559260.1 NADH-quinone oxidoreductase subunit M [Verrucomicrobiaceae bacterium]